VIISPSLSSAMLSCRDCLHRGQTKISASSFFTVASYGLSYSSICLSLAMHADRVRLITPTAKHPTAPAGPPNGLARDIKPKIKMMQPMTKTIQPATTANFLRASMVHLPS